MRRLALAGALALIPAFATAAPLPAADARLIDESVREWLSNTKAPSVSIAVVVGGEVAYVKAYGTATLAQARPATTSTRYAVDSVSKEFTASAALLLQEEGRLSLDDKVAKYFPDLASAQKVTLRQLLSHTAGYRDYWPQDYVTREMTRPVTLSALLEQWGKTPLDFEPGADWQYSNTGYVIAGAIVEKVAGQPLTDFLAARIFKPLHMNDVTEDDTAPLGPGDAHAYTRYALGPVRPATKEGPGWLRSAGELAMTPADLALWDISLMNRSLLGSRSYEALYKPTLLTSGKNTEYSLGLDVAEHDGRLVVSHGGGGSGFLAANVMYPKEKIAVIALTNNDWASPGDVVQRIADVVVPQTPDAARAKAVFEGFQRGTIDRALFTDNANAYLTPDVLADQKSGLSSLGPIRYVKLQSVSMRGGFQERVWTIATAEKRVIAVERTVPGGPLEQFMVSLAN